MIVCSACLVGMACKYNGKNNNVDERVVQLVKEGKAVPVCPEMLGGLEVPRIPSEIKGDKVIMADGKNVTEAFEKGAQMALAITEAIKADTAILMPRSPSCGSDYIYDGQFCRRLIKGDGVFVRLLKNEGIKVYQPDAYFEEGAYE
jgi:Uncharacterized conserved protein